MNWGCFGLFSTRFEVGFQASFSYLSKCLSLLVLEPNTFISKGEFSRVFYKRDFLSFSPQIYFDFSHTYLSFPLLYLSYRRVVVRVVLGDQSALITKVFYFVFEQANLRVRVVSSSCGSSV